MKFFVTGTDTGIGKTLVSCALLHAFSAQGKKVAGMKPVAAGLEGDEDINDDVRQLRAASNITTTLGQINPYSLPLPVAPHLAARHAGIRINIDRISESCNELAAVAEVVIIEGAGGFLVPLNEKEDMSNLAIGLDLPVIVVVGMRLGCLNHALLTARAIDHARLKCAGWVANIIDSDMPFLNENIDALQQRISAPLLGIIPHMEQVDTELASRSLDISHLQAENTE